METAHPQPDGAGSNRGHSVAASGVARAPGTCRQDGISRAGATGLDRLLRAGYIALAIFLVALLSRRGMDLLRIEALTSPRYAFDPGLVRLTPRPDWVGSNLDAAVVARLTPLTHCSILHPEFGRAFASLLSEVPWIRAVDQVVSGEDDVLTARVRYTPPVARLAGTPVFLDRTGAILPDAGVPLGVPSVRRSDGAPLGPGSRAVAAREVAHLLGRTGGKGPIWTSLRCLEVVPARRLDGREYRILRLWFARADGDGCCRVEWGRGAAEARGDDLDPDRKLAALERVHRVYPGWRGLEGAVVFAEEIAVRPRRAGVEATHVEEVGAP